MKHLILLIEEAGVELKDFESHPFLGGLRPMTTFALPPELQSLAAPREAFCSYNEDEDENENQDEAIDHCTLSTTIERIGITNSTAEVNKFIEHLLDHRNKWLNLSLIRLGLGGFNRLFPRGDHLDGGFDEEDFLQMKLKIDNKILQRAKGQGIRLQVVRDEDSWKEGWVDR